MTCSRPGCTRLALPETREDATPHCYFHASRQQKAAHSAAQAQRAHIQALAPELLAVLQHVRDCGRSTAWPYLTDCGGVCTAQIDALLARVEGGTE